VPNTCGLLTAPVSAFAVGEKSVSKGFHQHDRPIGIKHSVSRISLSKNQETELILAVVLDVVRGWLPRKKTDVISLAKFVALVTKVERPRS